MKANGVIAVLVALCLSVQCTGCSWLLMDRAPEDYIQHYDFECSGYGAPIADTIIGSLFLTLGFSFATYAFGASDECQAKPGEFGCMSPRSSAITAAIVLIPFGVIYGISAISGYCWANTCKETKHSHVSFKSNISPTKREELLLKKQEGKREELRKRCQSMNRDSRFYFKPEKWAFYLAICRKVEPNTTINSSVIMWVRRLHAAKKNVNESDFHGWTPLHYAAYTGHVKLVRHLLKKAPILTKGTTGARHPWISQSRMGMRGWWSY